MTLTADDTNQAVPKTIQKRIEIIQSCHCRPCDKVPKLECDLAQENTSELPQHMYTNKDIKTTTPVSDIPDKDLMFLLPKMNANSVSKLLNEDFDKRHNVSSKLLKILSIWENMPNRSASIKPDQEKLGNFFKVLQGQGKNDLNGEYVSLLYSSDRKFHAA